MKGPALDRFLMRKVGRHWDGVPVPHVAIKDLSRAAIGTFRKHARESRRLDAAILRESTPGLLDKLHLLDSHYLKRAAVLLFHPDPERFFTGSFVKIGFFRNNWEPLYQDEIHGDLFSQADGALDLLLTKYLKAGISYRGIQRIESLPVPEAALREVVLNAVIHKDYGSTTPIQISVYPDKLMLWNPGELPHDWTMAKLKGKHPSEPFNPDIANAFFRAGKIEAWGRGIERVFDACRAAGTPAPELRHEHGGLWVEFRFPQGVAGGTTQETPVEMSVETPVKMSVIALAKTPARILEFLRVNPQASLADVASVIGKTLRTAERASSKLVKDGRLRFVGPRKAGRWEVLK